MTALRANRPAAPRRRCPRPAVASGSATSGSPAAVGANGRAPRPASYARVEVAHRHGVGALEVLERLAGGAGASGRTSRRAPRPWPPARSTPSCGADRGVEVVGPGRRGERPVAGDGGQHPRLDLAEVGADEDVPGLRPRRPGAAARAGCAARSAPSSGRPRRRMPVQPPRSRPSGPTWASSQRVAVGGRDPLLLAPGQQRVHQRVGAAERLQPPRPGVRHDDPRRGEQLPHLRRVAQVGALAAGGVGQDGGVALAADRAGRASSSRRAGPGGGEDELLGVGRWIGRPSCSSSTQSSAAADSEWAVRDDPRWREVASACCCGRRSSRAAAAQPRSRSRRR